MLNISGQEYHSNISANQETFNTIKNVWVYEEYSDTVLDMINAVYYDKPLILTRATFREKLVIRQ